ncbi:SdpI family protein [Phenylobacterium sp.]|uniref:SdpI family protein n=1 Tax=Phenylobacterium sp. TaxID=1871053 RepID=UPI002897065F|nr:SdpI family protein [Phenylobacterium sp.]
MNRSLVRTAALAATAGQIALALYIARFGPTSPIPMHFDLSGEVDRWGTRRETAFVIGLMAGLSAVATFGLRHLSLGRRVPQASPRVMTLTTIVIVGVASAVSVLMAAMAFGLTSVGAALFGHLTISFTLAGIGAYLGKVAPNPLIGVRTPWTLASRLAWDKSNRLMGRLFFWGGLAGILAAPFAPQPAGLQALAVGLLAAAVLAVFESWRVWREDPDRAAWS